MTATGDVKNCRMAGPECNIDAAFSSYKDTRFFINLNGLRFICITMVLWHHAIPIDKGSFQLFGRGFMGVDFFFVLSGFLITTLLLREARERGRYSLRAFYIRRGLRILPVYFFVVTAVATYYIGIKGQVEYLQILPYYYIFFSNFLTEHIPTLTITWSLSIEQQYYLVWPALLLVLPLAARVPLLLLLIFINVVISAGWILIDPIAAGHLLFQLPNATYAPILLGSLLAILLDRKRSFVLFWWLLGSRWAALILAVALILALQLTPWNVLGWPNLLIHTTMTLMLAALVVRERTMLTPFLAARPVARVGEISYGIYLYHLIGLDIWMRILGPAGFDEGWMRLIGYSAISILLAEISFRTLEAWFRRYRPGGLPATTSIRMTEKQS
ncbi:acyltransferase family protein [Roseovarius sp. D0-M9]|uniref:acyltransferase family protein n=1 Tax=Roseovarius sp. D0-M9 TaxID=3127117 RepID=UPI00300FF663